MLKSYIPLLLLATPALSTTIQGFNFCDGPYALCSTSFCTKYNSTHAKCVCEGPFDGLNLGVNTSCKARSESLISTFSNMEEFTTAIQPPLYTFICNGTNAGQYADCLDAPCSTESGGVVCTCPMSSGANYYIGEKCPQNESGMAEICSKIRSTSTTSGGLTKIKSILGGFYANPPTVKECKIPG